MVRGGSIAILTHVYLSAKGMSSDETNAGQASNQWEEEDEKKEVGLGAFCVDQPRTRDNRIGHSTHVAYHSNTVSNCIFKSVPLPTVYEQGHSFRDMP